MDGMNNNNGFDFNRNGVTQPEVVPTNNSYESVQPEIVPANKSYESVQPEIVPANKSYENVQPESVQTKRAYESFQPESVSLNRSFETVQPEATQTAPVFANVQPEVTPAAPVFANVQPEATPVTPAFTNAQPEVTPAAPVTPAFTNVQPEAAPVTPVFANVQPEAAPATPVFANVQPEATPVTPAFTNVQPEAAPSFTTAQPENAQQPVMNSAPVASVPVQSLAEMKKESSKAKKEKGGKSIGKSLLCGLAFGVVAGVVSFGIWAAAIHFWGEELGVVNVASNTPGTIEPDSGEPDSSEPESTQPTQPDNSPLIASTDAEAAIIGVVNEAMPSIVSINTTIEMDIYGTVQDVPASGSGFIYKQHEDEYLITTNYHVVEGAKEIVVQFNDGSTAPATLKGKKISMDVAVLSVKVDSLGESTKAAIRPATIGDSDKLQVGQTAVAIGNALGYGQSVTSGVISALNREYTTAAGETNKFIQTDAAINPGNSGGALLNLNGEVIGINSNKYADETVEGMGFAIPITAVKDIIDNLSDKQELVALPEDQQSLFGISGASVGSGKYTNTGIPIPQGVYVAGVTPGLAADQAGIMQGDIITEFDGNSLADMNELLEYLAAYPAGTEVKITYKRYEDTGYVAHETTVTLGSKQ